MTQKENQSVCSNAEAVDAINYVPSFEEALAIPYVQESIEIVLDQNVKQYKVLAGYKDDLRQEVLIYLYHALTTFDPALSSFKTFFSRILHSAICNARYPYFMVSHLIVAYADEIDNFECDDDESEHISSVQRAAYARLAQNNVAENMLRADIRTVLLKCPPLVRRIALLYAQGSTTREISEIVKIPESTLRYKHFHILKEAFKNYF